MNFMKSENFRKIRIFRSVRRYWESLMETSRDTEELLQISVILAV